MKAEIKKRPSTNRSARPGSLDLNIETTCTKTGPRCYMGRHIQILSPFVAIVISLTATFTSSFAEAQNQSYNVADALPRGAVIISDEQVTPAQTQTSYQQADVPATPGYPATQNYSAGDYQTYQSATMAGSAVRRTEDGKSFVSKVDRYGNPKPDLDQYSPGTNPQGIGGLPSSGPEKIDPRALQSSYMTGAAGQSPLDSVGCQKCGGGYGNPRLWEVNAGVRVMHRNRASTTTMLIAENTDGATYYNSKSITGKSVSFDIAAGLYFEIDRYMGRDVNNNDYFFEAKFSGLNDWDNEDVFNNYQVGGLWHSGYTVNGRSLSADFYDANNTSTWRDITGTDSEGNTTHSLLTYVGIPGYDYAVLYPNYNPETGAYDSDKGVAYGPGAVRYRYESSLNAAELNVRIAPRGSLHDRQVYQPNGKVRRECRPGWANNWTVGLRYFNLDETATLSAFDIYDPILGGGSVESKTNNNLLGFQVGGELIDKHCMWNWGMQWKVGPLYNWSKSKIATIANDGTTLRFDENGQKLAAFADIGLWADYKIGHHWKVIVSYDWMWVTGVALAPSQIATGTDLAVREVSNGGTVFYQGLTLSLDYAW